MREPRHARRFEPLPERQAAPWSGYAKWDTPWLPQHLGVVFEEVRHDYARMRLPHRTEVLQPQGVVHGGALATMIDTVVVPAIAAVYDHRVEMITLTMSLTYLDALRNEDVIVEGWVVRRGRSIVFCRAECWGADTGTTAVTGDVTYKIRPLP